VYSNTVSVGASKPFRANPPRRRCTKRKGLLRRKKMTTSFNEAIEKGRKTLLSGIPPMPVSVLYYLGVAVKTGRNEATQRKMFGDETINWLTKAEECPEWQKFCLDILE